MTRHGRRTAFRRFGDRSIKALSRSDITKALDEIGDRSGSAANKAHKWLKKMFNFAVERGDLHGSPMDRMRPPHEEQSRERALDDRELRPVWLACEAIGYPFGPFTQLLLLTGQRLREVAGMRWEEFSEDAREWLIPGARTKNKQPHLLPLCELARSILLDIKARGIDSELVFTTNGRTPVSGFSKAKKRIDNYIAERPESVGVVAPWTFHDLRRTTATGCQRLGIPIDDTVKQGIKQRYRVILPCEPFRMYNPCRNRPCVIRPVALGFTMSTPRVAGLSLKGRT